MKKQKQILALVLALLMILSVTGCGQQGQVSSGSQMGNSESSVSTSDAGSESGTENADGERPKVVRYAAPGNEFPDQERALAYINQQMQEDGVNIELQLLRFPWDVWDQRCNLMFASNEEFELIHVMQDVKSAQALRAQGAIQPLNDYIDNYPLLRDTYFDGISAFTSNGEILAIGGGSGGEVKKIGTDYGRIFVREDMFPDGSTDAPTTPEEVIEFGLEIQQKLFEAEGEKYYTWTHSLSRPFTWLHRFWADPNDPIIVDNTTGLAIMHMDGSVESYYESETFRKDAEVYRQMYQAGLVHPDILTMDNEYKSNLGNYGKWIFGFETFDYQGESSMVEMIDVSINDFWLNPDMGHVLYFSTLNGNAVPASCSDPNVPLEFLNWACENEENFNTFMYGEQGVHYNITEDGAIESIKGPDDTNLYAYDSWQFGYSRWPKRGANTTDKEWEIRQSPVEGKIIRTPAVGFQFDSTNVANELANLNNELLTSIYPIKFGVVDYESNIDDAISRLKAAGLDKVMDEFAGQYKKHTETVKGVGVYEDQSEMWDVLMG